MEEPDPSQRPSEEEGRDNIFERSKRWFSSLQVALSLETPAERAEKVFFATYPRTSLQQELEKLAAEILFYLTTFTPHAILLAWLFVGLCLPISVANRLPRAYYGWVVLIHLALFAATLRLCVLTLKSWLDRLVLRVSLRRFSSWEELYTAIPFSFYAGVSLRLAVRLDSSQSKPQILYAKVSSALDSVMARRAEPLQGENAMTQLQEPRLRRRRYRRAMSTVAPARSRPERHTSEPPLSQPQPVHRFLSRQLQRQTVAAAAAVGALSSGGAWVLKIGAFLTALATLSGATLSVGLLRHIGVNPYDHINITDLPVFGLRFFPAFALTFGLFGAMIFWSAIAAWNAAHSIQTHRETMAEMQSPNRVQRAAGWVSSAWLNKDGYLMPLMVALASLVMVAEVVPRFEKHYLHEIYSSEACTYRVTWQKDAWSTDPPFSDSKCVAMVGMFGTNAIFIAERTTHIVPREKIASMRTEGVLRSR